MSLFQKLGLSYTLFSTHGQLQGLLTKKDAAFAVNSDIADIAGDEDGDRDGRRPGQGRAQHAHARQSRSLLGEMRGQDDGTDAERSHPLTTM